MVIYLSTGSGWISDDERREEPRRKCTPGYVMTFQYDRDGVPMDLVLLAD
jgi:hypothetical protein